MRGHATDVSQSYRDSHRRCSRFNSTCTGVVIGLTIGISALISFGLIIDLQCAVSLPSIWCTDTSTQHLKLCECRNVEPVVHSVTPAVPYINYSVTRATHWYPDTRSWAIQLTKATLRVWLQTADQSLQTATQRSSASSITWPLQATKT